MRTRAILVLALIGLICEFASGQTTATPASKFVGTFSNGVSVEFVGIGMNPSSKADWWQPDGSPLAERPYAKVFADMEIDGTARELCWRWHNVAGKDVQTGWHTEPGYNGAGGHAADENGKRIESLEAIAVSFNSPLKSCTVRFSITVPVSVWTSTIDTQAGHSSSTSKLDIGIGRVSAAFMVPRVDGTDTLVTVAYQIPNREVRLAAIDKNGQERVAERSQGGGFNDMTLNEYRFADVLPADLVRWQLQTRIRQDEVIEFRNVSLEPGQETEVQIVNAPQAPLEAVTGTLQLTTTASLPTPQPSAAANARYEKQQELIKQLSEQHGYKLDKGESLKYVPESESKPRQELQQSISNSMSLGQWMSGPEEQEDKYEPCLLIFEQTSAGDLRWVSSHNGITTLSEVLEHVLDLKRHQIECPPGLLMTYMPGDWVLSWDPRKPHEWSDVELAAFEKLLNEEKDLGVNVAWKTVERPVLVVTGEYKASPKDSEFVSGEVAKSAEGSFEIPARRSDIARAVGTYEELLQSIGEVLMLAVVDEATVRPTKPDFFWSHTGNPTSGQARLTPADEERVLQSLHEQLGYEFKIEPREVKLLSIESIEP